MGGIPLFFPLLDIYIVYFLQELNKIKIEKEKRRKEVCLLPVISRFGILAQIMRRLYVCVLGSVKGIKVNSKVGKGEEKKSGVSGSSANIYLYI